MSTISTNTSQIKDWRSIVTLIVFVLTNLVVLFPFKIPIYLPTAVAHGGSKSLVALRVLPRRFSKLSRATDNEGRARSWVCFRFPMNFITAPLIADLFLLAILAIGKTEVYDGTVGTDNISPIEIMAFFLTLAYIAISIDASGLIRYLAFMVLKWGGKVGHRLFFFLYAFFFALGSFIGNDPIILSGTAFLAYMTRVSSNIVHPRAWIYTQFAVANIASAILVSSNPTNLVLAGAFNIKFINYTANMIVPVVVTITLLFPFLLYILFGDEQLIPASIEMHELPEEIRRKKPVNPNIPYAKEGEIDAADGEQGKLLQLEEIMNPFIDVAGASFGAGIMAVTLITILVLNATSPAGGEHPVFWVTAPAAAVTFCWDVAWGWVRRKDTRELARSRHREMQEAEETHRIAALEDEATAFNGSHEDKSVTDILGLHTPQVTGIDVRTENSRQPSPEGVELWSDVGSTGKLSEAEAHRGVAQIGTSMDTPTVVVSHPDDGSQAEDSTTPPTFQQEKPQVLEPVGSSPSTLLHEKQPTMINDVVTNGVGKDLSSSKPQPTNPSSAALDIESFQDNKIEPTTLLSLSMRAFHWTQETFPTVVAVVLHLPFALVPFALCMFVLVQGLVTKGWIPVFAYGWDHWVNKTGTIGAVGGMGFLSVVLCNFAGTNIGTTILLSRVLQTWQQIHNENGLPISDRTFWASIYSMALGVNYGAFSLAFSASLAGLLWRDILRRKFIHVRALDFARINFPIIAISMAVGCSVLTGQLYITRGTQPYIKP